jgi:Flp pilus assembly protein TadD
MALLPRRTARSLASVAVLACLATAGFNTIESTDTTGSIALSAPPRSQAEWRRESETQGARYRAHPSDPEAALAYAQALRALSQRAQAVSVLQQASMHNPNNMALLGAYGRALADAGDYDQALEVLSRAHTPDQPDWRILSAQGAVLDQMGRHQEAQGYYSTALKIVPDEPSVLSNLGLSYALAKDLAQAEATLRRAVARPGVDPRVRQNLALVVGLQGRFPEAESIARADLPAEQAAANVAYLKQMLSEHKEREKAAVSANGRKPAPRQHAAGLLN